MRIQFNLFLIAIELLLSVFTSNCYSQSWLWARSGIGTGYDKCSSLCRDIHGNVFVTGFFSSPTITFGSTNLTNAGHENIFIVKYDANGNVLWAKSAGGSDDDEGFSISTDAAGNVFVTGKYSSPFITFGSTTLTNGGYYDVFIAKYDSSGNVLWAKNAGGLDLEAGNSVSTDGSGNVFVTGFFYSPTVTFGSDTLNNFSNTNFASVFIVKYDASGNVLWAKSAGGTGDDYGYSVSADSGGNLFLLGMFSGPSIAFDSITLSSNGGLYDIFIVKYDAMGNILWVKSAGGTGTDLGLSACADVGGNLLITGYFTSSSITFGTTTLTNANPSGNAEDVFIVKYDANGIVRWAKRAGGIDREEGYSVSADGGGNVFVAGSFYISITFDSLAITAPLGSPDPMFIVKYDANGNELCASVLASGGYFQPGVSVDPFGNAYIGGGFRTNFFIVGTDTLHLTGGENVFVAKYKCNCIPPSAPFALNTTICSGKSVSISAMGTGTIGWYSAAISGTYLGGGSNFTTPPLTTDTIFYVQDSTCAASATRTAVNVTINNLKPSSPSASNVTICSGNTASLHAMGIGTLGWYTSPTDGTYLGGGANFITSTLTTDTTFFVQDSTCTASSMRTAVFVTINNLKPPSPSASNITICSGNTASLQATGIGTLGWYTSPTDGTYLGGGANFITQTLTTDTTFYVQDSTCTASSMRTAVFVIINNLKPPSPSASNITICSGNTASLQATCIGTLGWYNAAIDGTYLGGGANFNTPILTSNTIYYVQDSTCAASSMRTAVMVTVNPLPDVTINNSGFTISAIQNGAVYQWLDGNNGNAAITGAINQSYIVTTNGNFGVIVSMNGCSDTSNFVNIIGTEISKADGNSTQLIIYPNPGKGSLIIQSTSDGDYSIMNETGQTIQVFKLNSSNKYSINIENLCDGIYFIVGLNNNQRFRQKVVVAK